MFKYILFAAAAVSSMSATAEEKATPVAAFREVTQYRLLICPLKAKLAQQNVELGRENPMADHIACIKDGRAEAKKLFQPALNSVAKKPAAGKILKDYYAAWLTAFDGSRPGQAGQAEQRQDELWNRFEIEAGI